MAYRSALYARGSDGKVMIYDKDTALDNWDTVINSPLSFFNLVKFHTDFNYFVANANRTSKTISFPARTGPINSLFSHNLVNGNFSGDIPVMVDVDGVVMGSRTTIQYFEGRYYRVVHLYNAGNALYIQEITHVASGYSIPAISKTFYYTIFQGI